MPNSRENNSPYTKCRLLIKVVLKVYLERNATIFSTFLHNVCMQLFRPSFPENSTRNILFVHSMEKSWLFFPITKKNSIPTSKCTLLKSCYYFFNSLRSIKNSYVHDFKIPLLELETTDRRVTFKIKYKGFHQTTLTSIYSKMSLWYNQCNYACNVWVSV